MIFETYRELVNYVFRNYPYDKIISYCKDLNYKWFFYNKQGVIVDFRYPRRYDIKKQLLISLSRYLYFSICSSSDNKLTEDETKISEIYVNYPTSVNYFDIHFGKDLTNLIISFKYEYTNVRFRKYSFPYINQKYGNPRTKVIFRFKEEIYRKIND